MDPIAIITIIGGIVIPMFTGGAWLWKRLDKKFDGLKDEMQKGDSAIRDEVHALRDEMHKGDQMLRDEMHKGDQMLREEVHALRDEMHKGDQMLREEMHKGDQMLREEMQKRDQMLRDEMQKGNFLTQQEIRGLSERVSRLETRVDERTLRVIYTAKSFEEKAQ